MRSIRDVLSEDSATLATAIALAKDEARIEVQMLLQQSMNVGRAYLLAHPEQILDTGQQAEYAVRLQRRLQGEPVAHILGEREFYGLSFKVTPDTLIPRPETELLVQLVLERIPPPPSLVEQPAIRPGPQAGRSPVISCMREKEEGGGGKGFRVLDLGTGSGAIALSVAHARPDIEVVGVDASIAALAVARENAQSLGIHNASFLLSDWFVAVEGQRFDLIVSNPPYIAAGDAHLKQGDVRFEPMSALASGADGLDDIRRIIRDAGRHLETTGWLMLEHGYDQAAQVRDLLGQCGFENIYSEKDLAGIARVSCGEV